MTIVQIRSQIREVAAALIDDTDAEMIVELLAELGRLKNLEVAELAELAKWR